MYTKSLEVKRNRYNAPYVVAIVTTLLKCTTCPGPVPLLTLAAISAVSRFTQYLPTCLVVIIFRRKMGRQSPFLHNSWWLLLIPVIAIGTSLWIAGKSSTNQLLWGPGWCGT